MPERNETDQETAPYVATPIATSSSRYKILRTIGAGGMGKVYLARDTKLQRDIALKRIRLDREGAAGQLRARIERECLIHARIGAHPNVVALYDQIECDGDIHLVMEYVKGASLDEWLGRRDQSGSPVGLETALRIIAQCLDGLAFVHEKGIIHRDFKPANVLVEETGDGQIRCKIMDFGISRLAGDSNEFTELTQSGVASPGTPAYMAPEQIDSDAFGEVSPATDVYAVAVTLYQILTGRTPFGGTYHQIMQGHLAKASVPLCEAARVQVPEPVSNVVGLALAKRRGERIGNAREFRDLLLAAAAMDGAPSKTVQPIPLSPGSQREPGPTTWFAARFHRQIDTTIAQSQWRAAGLMGLAMCGALVCIGLGAWFTAKLMGGEELVVLSVAEQPPIPVESTPVEPDNGPNDANSEPPAPAQEPKTEDPVQSPSDSHGEENEATSTPAENEEVRVASSDAPAETGETPVSAKSTESSDGEGSERGSGGETDGDTGESEPDAPPTQHTVEVGDTIGKIASAWEITVDQVFYWNDLKSDTIGLKDKLFVSPPSGKDNVPPKDWKSPESHVKKEPTRKSKEKQVPVSAPLQQEEKPINSSGITIVGSKSGPRVGIK